jgi:hypothetical protein
MDVEYHGDADPPYWFATCRRHSQEFSIERWDTLNHRRLAIETQKKKNADRDETPR